MTVNDYDLPRTGFHNLGKLTSATRTVAAQMVSGVAIAPVNVAQGYDHDIAGRPAKATHANINGNTYALETQYWADGSVKRKRLADGTWTGNFTYDLAGCYGDTPLNSGKKGDTSLFAPRTSRNCWSARPIASPELSPRPMTRSAVLISVSVTVTLH